MKRFVTTCGAAAALVGAASLATAPAASADPNPWWSLDPTKAVEVAPDPATAQGSVGAVTMTDDADGDHGMTVTKGSGSGQHYARVTAEATGFTPGTTYTVRVTARESGTGDDWGVYTWQNYTATADGALHINTRLYVPTNRAHAGEEIVAGVTVYRQADVHQDGRPAKQDDKCVFACKRVPPLAAWRTYNDPADTIEFTAA